MPVFQYKALKTSGQLSSGIVDADSPREARDKLRSQNLRVTEIAALELTGTKPTAVARALPVRAFLRPKRVSELATVTRQLATLLGAGIPLAEALKALSEQVEARDLVAVLKEIREQILQGSHFADALARHPRYFNDLYVNMVRAGEASGALDTVLARLADSLQKQVRLHNRVVVALTYPAILVAVATIVVMVLMGAVVPKILTLLQHQKIPLPWVTQLLVTLSDFVKDFWWLLVLGGLGLYAFYRLLVATDRGRYAADAFWLKVPVFGMLFRKQATSRFALMFATLLESGLPVMEALDIVGRVVNNRVLASVIQTVRQRIMEGADIATPLRMSKVFPPVVSYMVAVGEESGKLEELLRRVSESYDEEVEIGTQRMTSLLEPVLILAMAVVVGFIFLAILLPILQMSKM